MVKGKKDRRLWLTHSNILTIATIIFLAGGGWSMIYVNASGLDKETKDRKDDYNQLRDEITSAHIQLENKIEDGNNDVKQYIKDLLEQRDRRR